MMLEIDSAALHEMPPFAEPGTAGALRQAPLLAETHDLFAAAVDDMAVLPGEGFYDSLDDLLAADIEQAPEVIAGLQPGEVGVLFADAHPAADRLLLQLSVSLAAGDVAAPLLAANTAPRRVLYINSQWRLTYWRELLKAGLAHFADAAPARANLMLMSAKLGEPVVNLAEEGQAQQLLAFLKRQQADFVLIDNLMAFCDEAAEENSARHTRTLMRRLQQVARQANCVILLTESVRRGDGGSGRRAMLTGLADTVYRLTSDKREPSGVSVLRAEKSRGALPSAMLLRGEDDNSWFRITDEAPPETQSPLTVEELIAYVAQQSEAHTADIVRHFANRASPRKIAYLLKEAEMQERLVKDRYKGAWQVCRYQDPAQPTDEFAYQNGIITVMSAASIMDDYDEISLISGNTPHPDGNGSLQFMEPQSPPASHLLATLPTAPVSKRTGVNHLSRKKKKRRR
jgi:CheY-like chemotaxis protein